MRKTIPTPILPYLLLSLLLLPLFFIGGPDQYSSACYRYLWNFGHPIFFAEANITLLHYATYRSSSTTHNGKIFLSRWQQQWAIALIFTLILGLAIEYLQMGSARNASLADLFRNFIGTAIALSLTYRHKLLHQTPQRLMRGIQAFAILAILQMLLMLIFITQQEHQRLEYKQQQLPVLFNFNPTSDIESRLEVDDISGNALFTHVNSPSHRDESALKIQLTRKLYSGIALRNMPADWRAYSALALYFHNPANTAITITLRIDDLKHSRNPEGYADRFNQQHPIPPGNSHWVILLDDIAQAPTRRQLDLSDIRLIGLFSSRAESKQVLYLERVELQ